jgi:protoporphyrinogen IX oxidase
MTDYLAAAYPWLKALHIIAVIAWMAGLLYLPRLYVYHAMVPPESNRAAMLATMERRLLRGIMWPALIMVYGFGGALAATPEMSGQWQRGWLWTKLVLVLVLTWLHLLFAGWRRGFAAGKYPHGARFYRFVNEVPTMLMIAIVLLAVVKPF